MKYRRSIVTLLAACVFAAALTIAQDKKDKPPAPKPKEEKSKMTETKGKEIAVIETNMGTIELELFRADAPKTVDNFIGLIKKGYYNGITFHRVMDNFMIQGGDPTGTGAGGQSIYGKGFEDEISPNRKFDRAGLLAMANTGQPMSNGSQFFITLAPTTWLNGHHTIFGEVVSGMDVVKAIGKVQTMKPDKPVKDVVMTKVHMKSDTWEKVPEKKK